MYIMAFREFLIGSSLTAYAIGSYYYYQSSKTEDNSKLVDTTNSFYTTAIFLGFVSLI